MEDKVDCTRRLDARGWVLCKTAHMHLIDDQVLHRQPKRTISLPIEICTKGRQRSCCLGPRACQSKRAAVAIWQVLVAQSLCPHPNVDRIRAAWSAGHSNCFQGQHTSHHVLGPRLPDTHVTLQCDLSGGGTGLNVVSTALSAHAPQMATAITIPRLASPCLACHTKGWATVRLACSHCEASSPNDDRFLERTY